VDIDLIVGNLTLKQNGLGFVKFSPVFSHLDRRLMIEAPRKNRAAYPDDPSKAIMFPVTAGQFDLVYNALSFTLASMMASTIFFWIRMGSVSEKYKSAMTIT
jgi:hypothetical protein